jgi:hypothetical protein
MGPYHPGVPQPPKLTLPHCPNPVSEPDDEWWRTPYAERCNCRAGVELERLRTKRVHWVDRGRLAFCMCGPEATLPPSAAIKREQTPRRGVACERCLRRVPREARSELLRFDMPCCFCTGTAHAGHGRFSVGHTAPLLG